MPLFHTMNSNWMPVSSVTWFLLPPNCPNALQKPVSYFASTSLIPGATDCSYPRFTKWWNLHPRKSNSLEKRLCTFSFWSTTGVTILVTGSATWRRKAKFPGSRMFYLISNLASRSACGGQNITFWHMAWPLMSPCSFFRTVVYRQTSSQAHNSTILWLLTTW